MTATSANPDTADKTGTERKLTAREREWAEIEDLVMEYKKQFEEDASREQVKKSQESASELLERFLPLFKKYLTLIKTGQIDFDDKEMKQFVSSFIDEPHLRAALRKQKQGAEDRSQIYQNFNFIKETYGALPEEEILTDLQEMLLIKAKRYKQMNRNFCAYLYNSFRFEVMRHIKKFVANPLNIPYKNAPYEDYMRSAIEPSIENNFEDSYYEDSLGIPDLTWIQGESCSDLFLVLTPMERKLIVKYYLEDWNDRQISEAFGIHINTVNQKRRLAAGKIAEELGIDPKNIKRNRKSGKQAILPTRIE